MLQTTIILFRNCTRSDRHIWFSGGLKQSLHICHMLQVWHLPKWPWQNHTRHIPHGSLAWSVQPGCAHSDAYCLDIFGKESCSSWATCKTFKSSSVETAMFEEDLAHYSCERKIQLWLENNVPHTCGYIFSPPQWAYETYMTNMLVTWYTSLPHPQSSSSLHADKVTRQHSRNNTASITDCFCCFLIICISKLFGWDNIV